MPLSLRIIKELASKGIDWKGLHLIDVMSLYYSLLIDSANSYLEHKRTERLNKRGISEVRPASVDDFDKL